MGETTSLTIHPRKGEDISPQNHVNAGEAPDIPDENRMAPGRAGPRPASGRAARCPGQPAWQPSSSAVLPLAVVRSVTTLSMRVAEPVKRKSARPTSVPSAACERRVQ